MTRPRLHATALLAAAALTAAGTAPAADATAAKAPAVAKAVAAPRPMAGLTTIDLQGPAHIALARHRVTVAGLAPAQLTAADRVLLPVDSGAVAATTQQLLHGGALRLTGTAGGRRRTLMLTRLRLDLDATPALSAVASGKRIDVLSIDVRRREYTATPATGTVRIVTARASLTAAAAAAATKRLRVRIRPGLLGVLGTSAGNAVAATTTPSGAAVAPGAAAPPAMTVPGAPTTITPLARPATAQDLAADSLTWHVRESLVRYLNQAAPIGAANGVTLGQPVSIDGASPMIYDATYAAAGGWSDPVSGQASLRFTGTVHLSYPAHGIDITISDPQVELSGESSRVLATFGGASATASKGLGILAALDPADVAAQGSGATTTWTAVPGAVPNETASAVFAGFYSPGDPFGRFTFSLTRPF